MYKQTILNNRKAFLITCLLLIAGCTAHYPVNESIDATDRNTGYRPGVVEDLGGERSDTLLVILAFSGGGTRAAAFSYGVLEALRDITITWEGRERLLLDEVDSISSVSGGSFTSAYYGLFGDRIFEDYADKFLYQDVESKLKGNVLNPFNWPVLGSLNYGRSDMAAEYYDEIMFEGKTFGDLLERQGPLIQINATEVSTGTQFTFVQGIFDVICSDLIQYSVSRAVAASSAVPILFSSITINNYAGSCNHQLLPLFVEALNDPDPTSRRRHIAEKYAQYLDSEQFPYMHLYDGGLTDNLGVRPGINRLALAGGAWDLAKVQKKTAIKRMIFIIVNAQAESKSNYSKSSAPVPLFDTILGATSIPLNEYTFESLVTLKTAMSKFSSDFKQGRCEELARAGEDTTDCGDFKEYMVVVDLGLEKDKEQREKLLHLPTSFVLQPEEVDELRESARSILNDSSEFKKFLDDVNNHKSNQSN